VAVGCPCCPARLPSTLLAACACLTLSPLNTSKPPLLRVIHSSLTS
jgi:hypothetical protein